MSTIGVFFFWIMTVMGLGPNADTHNGLQELPLACEEACQDTQDSETDWVEIQLRLISNGKDSIFNGV
jgi:hypothetical protein